MSETNRFPFRTRYTSAPQVMVWMGDIDVSDGGVTTTYTNVVLELPVGVLPSEAMFNNDHPTAVYVTDVSIPMGIVEAPPSSFDPRALFLRSDEEDLVEFDLQAA